MKTSLDFRSDRILKRRTSPQRALLGIMMSVGIIQLGLSICVLHSSGWYLC